MVLISEKSAKIIERKLKRVWSACLSWAQESNSNYNVGKTEENFIEGDQKRIRLPMIKIGQISITPQEKMKYLRFTLDRVLNYTEHLKTTRKKTK